MKRSDISIMKRIGIMAVTALLGGTMLAADGNYSININTRETAGLIDPKIYGQLFEHIYFSANNGVWQELINERSFEPEQYPGITPRDGYFDGWFVDDDNVLHSPTRYEQPLDVAEVAEDSYDISMNVDWRAYKLARRMWSGGLLDLRIAFGQTAEGNSMFFRITDPFYEGRRANAGQTAAQQRAYDNDKARAAAQQQLDVANFSFTSRVQREVAGFGGMTRKVEVMQAFAAKAAKAGEITAGGKFHKLLIKVRGNDVKAYWDGRNVLSAKMPEGCRPQGKVTLWEYYTEAVFSNITIKNAKGNTLFAGQPKDVQVPNVAQQWEAYGDAEFALVKGDAVNMNYSQRISPLNGAAGVKQGPQWVISGNPFVGSIYAKGNGKANLAVMLKQGTKVVAKADLGRPTADWRKYEFTLDAGQYAGDADFCIEAEGGMVQVDEVSMATAQSKAMGGFRPDIYNKVKELGVSCMRWPGGGYAAQYDWRWGVGPQEKRYRWDHWQWMDYDQNCFGTDEFLRFCQEMNSEPVIVVSVGFDRPDSEYQAHIDNAVNWLRYCNEPATGEWGRLRAANGHPAPYNVRYWEIDNEMWEMGIERYEKAVHDFSAALRAADPSIKIIVCGGFGEDADFIRRSANCFDYMSLHHYEQAGGYLTGPRRLEEQAQRYAKMIAESDNPHIKLYYSEWNLQTIDWRTGLFAAGFLNMCERNPVIEMGAAALFIRRTDMPDWNNAFINFDYKDVFVAPNYQVTKLWHDHFSRYRLAYTGDTGDISVSTTLSEDGRNVIVKLANATDKSATLNLSGDWAEILNADMKFYAPGDLTTQNSMANKNAVALQQKTLSATDKTLPVDLPAYSAAVVTMAIKHTAK